MRKILIITKNKHQSLIIASKEIVNTETPKIVKHTNITCQTQKML